MNTHRDRTEGVGARVAYYRKILGWSQRRLAREAGMSESLVKKVEAGHAPASPAFTAAAARALKVETGRLLGQPYAPEEVDTFKVHAVVPALRRELAAYRLPPDPGLRPRSLAQLRVAVKEVSRLRHSATLDTLGAELPGLIEELRSALWHAPKSQIEKLYGLLAEAYAAAGQVAYKLGYADLSSLTTERVEWSAHRSGDPLACAAADFYVAGELIATAEWAGAIEYLDSARDRIEDELRGSDEAALAMFGQLHLKSGLAAARAGDGASVDDHLAEARSLAEHVTMGSDYYRLAFDADSVSIWAVSLAVEQQDGVEAIKRAQGLTFSASTPQERVGHHWIDLARGYQLHGYRKKALEALWRARRISPQQTRYHPQVRETLVTLAEKERRVSEGLSEFARWVGLAL